MGVQILGWEVVTGTDLCAKFSPPCLPHICCAPLWGSKASSLPCQWVWGVSECAEAFASSQLPPWVQDPFHFLCFFIFLLSFPYHFMWCLVCLFQTLRASASVQQMFCRSCFTWRCIFDVLGRKTMFMSYSSTIFNPSRTYYYNTPPPHKWIWIHPSFIF